MSKPDLRPCPFCGDQGSYDSESRSEDQYCGRCNRYGCRDPLHYRIALAGCSSCGVLFREEWLADDYSHTMEEAQARVGEQWNMRGVKCDTCYNVFEPKVAQEVAALMDAYSPERICDKCAPPIAGRVEAEEWIQYLTDDEIALLTQDRRPLLMEIAALRLRLRAVGPKAAA